MGSINPINLTGNWKEGYALDYYSISSQYLGIDSMGNKRFETKRTNIGELLYELKYRQNKSKLNKIIKLIKPFLSEWDIVNKIDVVIPVPSTEKKRTFQPVNELCKNISFHLNKKVAYDVLEKTNSVKSKDLFVHQKGEIIGTILKKKNAKRILNILLIDDVYDTGETLRETVRVLKTDPNIQDIYVLTLTKTG